MAKRSRKAKDLIVPVRTSAANSMLAQVGKRVGMLRAQRAMTRKRLAELSGVSIAYLARLERGNSNISLQLLQKVAKALGVGMETLIGEDAGANIDLILIMDLLRRVSPTKLMDIRSDIMESCGQSAGSRSSCIALIGLRGAGKSTLGELLARKLERPFIELDKEIEREAGLGIREIFEHLGQAEFRRIELACLERLDALHEDVVIATAGGIVSEPKTFAYLLSTCLTVFLKATPEEHISRVVQQRDTRITAPEIRKEARQVVESTLEARKTLYERADITLDTTDQTVQQSLRSLMAQTVGYLGAREAASG